MQNNNLTMLPNCRTADGCKSTQKKVYYFRILALKSINVHSTPEEECSSFRKLSNQRHNVQCSFGACWKTQSCSPHCRACQGQALFCLTSFAFLSDCFCHSAANGFSPSPLLSGHFCCLQLLPSEGKKKQPTKQKPQHISLFYRLSTYNIFKAQTERFLLPVCLLLCLFLPSAFLI